MGFEWYVCGFLCIIKIIIKNYAKGNFYQNASGDFLLLSTESFAQNSSVYNAADSNVISSKGKSQQNQFMNNTYDFPAKPRNELEVSISGGLFTVSGHVAARLLKKPSPIKPVFFVIIKKLTTLILPPIILPTFLFKFT